MSKSRQQVRKAIVRPRRVSSVSSSWWRVNALVQQWRKTKRRSVSEHKSNFPQCHWSGQNPSFAPNTHLWAHTSSTTRQTDVTSPWDPPLVFIWQPWKGAFCHMNSSHWDCIYKSLLPRVAEELFSTPRHSTLVSAPQLWTPHRHFCMMSRRLDCSVAHSCRFL